MTDYPEDILRAAEEVAMLVIRNSEVKAGTKAIAAALAAERERATEREKMFAEGLEEAWFQLNLKDCMGVEQARIHARVRLDIALQSLRAAAIRKGDTE